MKFFVKILLVLGLVAGIAPAEDIVVSWESNGVLRAEGLVPGSSCIVEWASDLEGGFTVNDSPFAALTADSNGVLQVAIPMFFKVRGVPQTPVPEGMVEIPGGTNSGTDPDFGSYSLTVSTFNMDSTEITKDQWDTVYSWAMTNGYSFSSGSGKYSTHPVQSVSWYDCVKWCNARSEMDGRTPCYTVGGNTYKTGQSVPDCNFGVDGYRLPTSDEWEYAARGGLIGKRYPWGDSISHVEANVRIGTTHPTYSTGGIPYTNPVGDFAANGYGLYDVAGNLYEWCWDTSGSDRITRGGSWDDGTSDARCGNTHNEMPDNNFAIHIGFRAVCRY